MPKNFPTTCFLKLLLSLRASHAHLSFPPPPFPPFHKKFKKNASTIPRHLTILIRRTCCSGNPGGCLLYPHSPATPNPTTTLPPPQHPKPIPPAHRPPAATAAWVSRSTLWCCWAGDWRSARTNTCRRRARARVNNFGRIWGDGNCDRFEEWGLRGRERTWRWRGDEEFHGRYLAASASCFSTKAGFDRGSLWAPFSFLVNMPPGTVV